MTSGKLRNEFLNFFEKKRHTIVSSSSLLPIDQSVLFTTAGMQQFKQYFLGEKSPYGQNAASCQKCFRTSDIDEVGDESHLTFFEMLGNFSFGGYGKEKAIKTAKEFLDSIGVKIDYVTVFSGDKDVLKDQESADVWRKLGFSEEDGRLRFCGREDNFWGPTGEEGPCGPTTEIYSGGAEIWNLVFNEYCCDRGKKLTPLKQIGVDTGMGLERLAMVLQAKPSVFEIDLFLPVISSIPGENKKAKRIIADHVKAAVFLIQESVFPSNIERGYVLRRVLRRAIRIGKLLDLQRNFLLPLAEKTIEVYKNAYPELKSQESEILTVIQNEEEGFSRTLEKGIKQFDKIAGKGEISGEEAFRLFDTFGFPLELTEELSEEKNISFDKKGFAEAFERHQEISRTGAEKKFKSGLADHSQKATKYHTATHLLLAAMREVLGSEIYQKSSNITAERLRFDFNYPQKLNQEQIVKVENLVNEKIKENIEVEMIEMFKAEALKIAKVSFDTNKYGDIVKVYKIGDFSIELCGGPHVKRTGELGRFKITKEESSGAGVRRIRAALE